VTTEAQRKFQTYLFFLRHFGRAIRQGRDDSSLDHLLQAVCAEQEILLDGVATHDLTPPLGERIRKLLFNAWNSETVARMNSVFDLEVRFITNQWKPVQTYYALYFLLAAIHELHAPGHRPSHEQTLRFATDSVAQRFPSPWCCAYDFDVKTCHRFPWPNLATAASGWNLANHPDPYAYMGHFYRTTGLEKRYEKWREHGKGKKHRPGHPKAGRRILIADVRAGSISFWDVLWRMRKWVNYKEAEAVLAGQESLDYVEEFDDLLNEILAASSAVLERFLCELLGAQVMNSFYGTYLHAVGGKADCYALSVRRDLFCGPPS
jgi:hypothetical protein